MSLLIRYSPAACPNPYYFLPSTSVCVCICILIGLSHSCSVSVCFSAYTCTCLYLSVFLSLVVCRCVFLIASPLEFVSLSLGLSSCLPLIFLIDVGCLWISISFTLVSFQVTKCHFSI